MNTQEETYLLRDEVYYKNLPVWPEFDIYNKSIDGLIPSAKLESWEQFHDIVKSYRLEKEGEEYIFRGQHHYKWELQPTLDRFFPGAIQHEIAKKQLRNFRLSIRGRVENTVLSETKEEELWAIGQHHGLATPLLDWTRAPYVALFFSFVNEDPDSWLDDKGNPDNHSRTVYILNKSFIEDLIDDHDPLELGYPKIIEPSKDDHGRLVNQAGLFTIAPYGETLESALIKALVDSDIDVDNINEVKKYICKLHIPNSPDVRRDCLRHLRKMNIHHASLFPDVIGASGYCNELIRELLETNKMKRVEPEQNPKVTEKLTDTKATTVHPSSPNTTNLKKLSSVLVVNARIKKLIHEEKLIDIAKHIVEFVDNEMGIDWYIRESQIARLKNVIRRSLKRINFPEDDVRNAAHLLAQELALISLENDASINSTDSGSRDAKVHDLFRDAWGETYD